MLNYRQGKKRYKPNELGSLYIDESKLDPNTQPIIYIGGQMEHRIHSLEQLGFTHDLGHNMFTGSWFYDYPLFSPNKGDFKAENFSKNLLQSLEQANLDDVILITESYGGTIASLATKSERVSQVVAIHPSILGTPLANPEYLEGYRRYYTLQQKSILHLLKTMVSHQYGFQQDNFHGVDFRKVDLNKLLVVGSNIDIKTEKNQLMIALNDMIEKAIFSQSDGVVVFEPQLFEQKGIQYLQEDENLNHFKAGSSDHIAKVYQKTINKNSASK